VAPVDELGDPERVPVATANSEAALLEKLSEEVAIVELGADDEKELLLLLATLELLWKVEVLEVEVLDVEVDVDVGVGVVLVLVVVLLWVVEVVLGGV